MKSENEALDVNDTLQEECEKEATPPTSEEIEAQSAETNEESDTDGGVDYAALARQDLIELKSRFPELSEISDLTELDNPLRYGALRDLGLTPEEAYLATRKRQKEDNRAHLRPTRSVARGAAPLMTEAEMNAARELFSGVSDSEIRQLYKRVTK